MNDNHPITDLGARALAAFIHEARPDFDAPGVVAALRAERDTDVWQLAQRMIRRAANPANTTPRLQAFDTFELVGCRLHQSAGTRTDGTCGGCFSDRLEAPGLPIRDRGGKPIPDSARALVEKAWAIRRAELHPETTP